MGANSLRLTRVSARSRLNVKKKSEKICSVLFARIRSVLLSDVAATARERLACDL